MGKKQGKGIPPIIPDNNLNQPSQNDLIALGFKVDDEFLMDFKEYALKRRMKLVDLLKVSFAYYQEKHPVDP